MKIKRIRIRENPFNPGRTPNQLIRALVEHAEIASKIKKADRRAHSIKTEGGAARYLKKLMSKLHPHNTGKVKRLSPASKTGRLRIIRRKGR